MGQNDRSHNKIYIWNNFVRSCEEGLFEDRLEVLYQNGVTKTSPAAKLIFVIKLGDPHYVFRLHASGRYWVVYEPYH